MAVPRRLVTASGPREAPGRVLVVAAHPDDIDFGSAGTVAALVEAGASVSYCLVTSGEAGGRDRGQPRAEMAALREAEQRAAATAVGVDDVHFLRCPDGRLVPGLELRLAIARVIRQVCPDVVIGPSPQRDLASIHRSHPDHRAVGECTMDAVYPDARNPFAFPELLDEGLEPHSVEELWLTGGPDPDLVVDVGEVIDRKVAALRAHASQVGWIDDVAAMIRSWSADVAERAGMPDGSLAEAFRVVDTR